MRTHLHTRVRVFFLIQNATRWSLHATKRRTSCTHFTHLHFLPFMILSLRACVQMLKTNMLLEPFLFYGSLPLLASAFGFSRVIAKMDDGTHTLLHAYRHCCTARHPSLFIFLLHFILLIALLLASEFGFLARWYAYTHSHATHLPHIALHKLDPPFWFSYFSAAGIRVWLLARHYQRCTIFLVMLMYRMLRACCTICHIFFIHIHSRFHWYYKHTIFRAKNKWLWLTLCMCADGFFVGFPSYWNIVVLWL